MNGSLFLELEDEITTLDRSAAAGDQLYEQHHNGDNQQNMDQISDCRTGKAKSKSPKNQQNDKYSPQHSFILLFLL